jgi:UDP-glucose 4-epimerase
MRILITGSSGFIGKYLTKYLSARYEIIAPSSKDLDLTDTKSVANFFKDQRFDAVIHSAVRGRNNVTEQSDEVYNDIVSMFENLFEHSQHYDKLIQFGSGAEFGLDKTIEDALEDDILKCYPRESYGLGKNIVARAIRAIPNFFTLRVFACFDPSETDNRLIAKFKKIVESGKVFEVDQDRYVDFVSLQDIATVVDAVLNNQITDNDINVVYQQKCLISEILKKYCEVNGVDKDQIIITGVSDKNYTGNGDRLAKYNLNLQGVIPTLQRYKNGSI